MSDLDKDGEAKEYFEEAARLYKQVIRTEETESSQQSRVNVLKTRRVYATTLRQIGDCEAKENKFDKAHEYYDEARQELAQLMQLDTPVEDRKELADLHQSVANAHLATDEAADDTMENAVEALKKAGELLCELILEQSVAPNDMDDLLSQYLENIVRHLLGIAKWDEDGPLRQTILPDLKQHLLDLQPRLLQDERIKNALQKVKELEAASASE
jgi:hypothetical protein